jgi:RNA polymerase sigma factor FliA
MSQPILKEQQNIWELWLNEQDPQAGEALVKMYTPLVSYHVQRIAVGLPKNVSKDELYSLGMMGLFDALNKFDPSRDLKFDTYASFRIRGAILDGLRKEDWLPRGTREKAKKIEATIELLEQRYMRTVTAEEVAVCLDMSVEEVTQTMNEHFFANVLSIDEQNQDTDEKESYVQSLTDKNELTPEEIVLKDELIQQLSEEIKKLTEKEQLVLSLFYKEELTLTEIGEVMNLSTSRISQIHSKAIYKLRKLLKRME